MLFLLVALPASALAQANGSVLVLPILSDGKLDHELAEYVSKMTDSVVQDSAHDLASRDALRAIRKPRRLARDCGRGTRCLANLGKLASAELVVVSRAIGKDGGIDVSFTSIVVATKKVLSRVQLSFRSKQDVRSQLQEHMHELLAGPGQSPAPQPLEPSGPARATNTDAISPEMGATEPAIPEVSPASPTVQTPPENSTATDTEAAPERQAPDYFAVSKPPAAASATTEPWWEDAAYFSYAGLGLAGSGLTFIAAGAAFGLNSIFARADTTVASGVSQIEANRNNRNANRSALRANSLYVTGGVLAAAGAMLFAWDSNERGLFWRREP